MTGRRRFTKPDAYEVTVRDQQTTEALPPRSLRPLKVLALFAVFAVVFALGRNGLPGDGPAVDGGCDRPALALDQTVIRQFGSVRWTVAGPAGATVVLAVDSTSVPSEGALVRTVLGSCEAHGVVGISGEPGRHTVTAWVVVDGQAQVAGTRPLEIVAP